MGAIKSVDNRTSCHTVDPASFWRSACWFERPHCKLLATGQHFGKRSASPPACRPARPANL